MQELDPIEGRSDLLYTTYTTYTPSTPFSSARRSQDRGRTTMEKIQVMLPDELIQYLKELVADPENPLQSVSGAIRWIIQKEMKTHETK